MEIKKFTSSITNFIIKRVIELFGVVLIILSILLFAALLTYSPQDPNFVFSNIFFISIKMNQIYHFVSFNNYC